MDAMAIRVSHHRIYSYGKYVTLLLPPHHQLNPKILVVLQLRIYALYGRSKKVLMLILPPFILSIATAAVFSALDIKFEPGAEYSRYCYRLIQPTNGLYRDCITVW